MTKILVFLFIGFTAIGFSQNETTTTTLTSEEASKIEQESIPVPTQTVQPSHPVKKKQAKNEDEKKSVIPFIKKFYFGGTFGATFGSYTSITAAPVIGYRLRPSLYTGLKIYYLYSKQRFNGTNYTTNSYGFGTFLRWFAFKDLYLHIAPEVYNYETFAINGDPEHEWVPFLWAGAGIRKKTSKHTWISIHVLFDLINDKNSPYEQWEPNFVIGAGRSF